MLSLDRKSWERLKKVIGWAVAIAVIVLFSMYVDYALNLPDFVKTESGWTLRY